MNMRKILSVLLAVSMISAVPSVPVLAEEGESETSGTPILQETEQLAEQLEGYSGTPTKIYSNTYAEPGNNRNWRDGMVSGNGKNGVVTSGAPYSDTLIYQNMYLIMPSNSERETLEVIKTELEDARQHVFDNDPTWNLNGRWWRDFDYTFHPGHQLRLSMEEKETSAYQRWTDYETAEVGVTYTDADGEWERRTFASRADDVVITEITQSSEGEKVNMTISIDNPSSMYKFGNGDERNMQYKKLVDEDADYIAQAAHYPEYEKSELKEGGYAGVTQVVTVGGTKEKISLDGSKDSQNVGDEANPGIQIKDADAVYLITRTDRTHNMGKLSEFAGTENYDLVDSLYEEISAVTAKYTKDGTFSYEAAVTPHTALHSEQFDAVKFSLDASEDDRGLSTEALLNKQKKEGGSLNAALVERAYNAGRYAQLCCAGYSTSRLCGMWTGEWNPGWHGYYTMDANVNLQASPMNTGHLEEAAHGFIYFVLRQIDDWMQNAEDTYGMHDAIQVPVNTDGDRAPMIESDAEYPFQYWNTGASWMLLPIYEYWQCYGNQQIPIIDVIDLQRVRGALGVNDGGLSEEEAAGLIERGYLDLEEDILRPLLTKQANFWEQLCTPEYYIGTDGEYYHDPDKQDLEEGERYLLLPTYSPENAPSGSYNSRTTLNATMDIAAAKDGLSMAINMEKVVTGEETNAKIEKWEELLSDLPEYEYDGVEGVETSSGGNGALREWSTQRYTENNNHRHISHLYVAWPAYETQYDEDLEKAAKAALANRDRLNTGDNTTGHGWMHHSLISARLKDGTDIYDSLLHILSSDIYYMSMLTDHNTNRGSDTYCTDTSIGMVGVINEALAFSNTGEIQILPALPEQWITGSIDGMMARTRAEIEKLSWDLEKGIADVQIRSDIDQTITLTSGMPWETVEADAPSEPMITQGEEVKLTLSAGETAHVRFIREDVSKEDLKKSIDSAKEELNAKLPENFPVSDETANKQMEDAIIAAEGVYNDENASAEEIREAAWELIDALRMFREAYTFSMEVSLPEGIYSGRQEVTLSFKQDDRLCARYTTDGSEPDADSPVYEDKMILPQGITELKAAIFAAETGEKVGDTLTMSYQCNIGPNYAKGKSTSTPNNSYSNQGTDRAVDGNSGTRWSALGGDGNYQMEVDFKGPYTFDSIAVDEYVEVVDQEDHRIEQFKVQYDDGSGEWKTAYSFDQEAPEGNYIMLRPDPDAGASHAYYGASFEPVTAEKVRLVMKATKEVSIWEFSIYNNEDRSTYDNVALKKPVTASSYDGPTPTQNAVDGNWDTRWAAGSYHFPELLTVDLQGQYYIESMYTLFELPSAFQFIIEYSSDAETWKTYTDCRDNTALITENYAQMPIAANYVRITLTGSSDRAWASLWEFQVYGSEITDISPQEISGQVNEAIRLPEKITVTLADGEVKEFAALWENETVTYQEPGTYQVTGSIPELDDMSVTVSIRAEGEAQPVSKKTLEYYLNSAKEHLANGDVDDCVESIRNLFRDAIAEGEAVMADEYAARDEVMNASVKLMKAIQALGMKAADKTDLEMAAELAEMIDLTDYVEAGQQEFKDAFAAANEVLADGDAMQPETDAAWNALLEAMEGLRLKADKSVLEDLINEAAGLDLNQYTEESVSVFSVALLSAQNVLADEALSVDNQRTVDNAVYALRSAKAALVLKTDDTGDAEQGGDDTQKPDDGSQSGDDENPDDSAQGGDDTQNPDDGNNGGSADVNQGGNVNHNNSAASGNSGKDTSAGSGLGAATGNKAAKTGDTAPIAGMAVLILAAGAAAAVAAGRRKRMG